MNRTARQILRQLVKGPKGFWHLIRHQDSSIKEFIDTLRDLEDSKTIKREGSVFKLNTKNLIAEPYRDFGCEVGEGKFNLSEDFMHLKERFGEVVRERPLPKEDYDQGFMRKEDTVKRAVFMYERGDVEGKDIFILGDDDLLSIALGLMKLARSITVVEADRRIVRFITAKAKELNLQNVQAIEYNALNDLPPDLYGRCHTFVTDPVETWLGFKVFVGRCIQALKGKGCSGYFGLTHLEASLKKWYEFEKFLMDCSFVITDILRDFNFYPEDENKWQKFYESYRLCKEVPDVGLPEIDWYRSSFIRIEAVDSINYPKLPPSLSPQQLYFDEETWATPGAK